MTAWIVTGSDGNVLGRLLARDEAHAREMALKYWGKDLVKSSKISPVRKSQGAA